MSNSIAPGSSADVNVKVTALTTNPNVPVTYKTIILKKNLVNGVNTLTQEMMSAANTKYVIKYDYVLGEDVTVPANCILEFDGGNISAGIGQNIDTITGNNTGINAGLIKIFNTNITLVGGWNVIEAYPEWFGAKGDGTTDDVLSIQKAIDFAYDGGFVNVKLAAKEYLISIPIVVWGGIDDIDNVQEQPIQKKVNLIGTSKRSTKIIKKTNTTSSLNDNSVDAIIIIATGRYKDGYISPSTESDPLIVAFGGCIKNITICGLSNNYREYGIYALGINYYYIEDINVFYCNNGLYTKTWNCYSHYYDIGCTLCANGFNFGETHLGGNTTMNFKNCHINGCTTTGFKLIGSGILENCSCDGGTCDAIYFNKYVRADITINSDFVISKFHHESLTGRLLYNDNGKVLFVGGSSIIGQSANLNTPYIECVNLSETTMSNYTFSMITDEKAKKLANVDATSILFINDKIVSNCLFNEYTKINYNNRIKEIINPYSNYVVITNYYSSGESGDFSTLSVTSSNNELRCIYERLDRTNEEAIEFSNKIRFEKGSKIVAGISIESENEPGLLDDVYLAIFGELYEDGHRSVNQNLNLYSKRINNVGYSQRYDLKKSLVVFDTSELEGDYYIGFCIQNAGKRKITIYDIYYVK